MFFWSLPSQKRRKFSWTEAYCELLLWLHRSINQLHWQQISCNYRKMVTKSVLASQAVAHCFLTLHILFNPYSIWIYHFIQHGPSWSNLQCAENSQIIVLDRTLQNETRWEHFSIWHTVYWYIISLSPACSIIWYYGYWNAQRSFPLCNYAPSEHQFYFWADFWQSI